MKIFLIILFCFICISCKDQEYSPVKQEYIHDTVEIIGTPYRGIITNLGYEFMNSRPTYYVITFTDSRGVVNERYVTPTEIIILDHGNK